MITALTKNKMIERMRKWVSIAGSKIVRMTTWMSVAGNKIVRMSK